MTKNDIYQAARRLTQMLQAIDYAGLPISDYNKHYISNLKQALPYYMKIYTECLWKGISLIDKEPGHAKLIDYGGGSGFLSMLAKQIGFGQVVYIDLNPQSVETIGILKELTGTGPDHILQGDIEELNDWRREKQVHPELLISTDVIEHVNHIESFFAKVTQENNQMTLVFTTGSNNNNPHVRRKLHRYMNGCEYGDLESPNYLTLRKDYLAEHYPHLNAEQLCFFSAHSRGLDFAGIDSMMRDYTTDRASIASYFPKDPFNTCDPRNGNWTERLLPVDQYQEYAGQAGYHLRVDKGFYNTERKNPVTSLICSCINRLISISGKPGLALAPFIFLVCIPKAKQK